MHKYFYSNLDILTCNSILNSYSKQTKYLQRAVKVTCKKDYFIIDCSKLNMRACSGLAYKLKMSRYINKTLIEVEQINCTWFEMEMIITKFWIIFINLTVGVTLLFKIKNIDTFASFCAWLIFAFFCLKTFLALNSVKKDMNALLATFLEKKLGAEEKMI